MNHIGAMAAWPIVAGHENTMKKGAPGDQGALIHCETRQKPRRDQYE